MRRWLWVLLALGALVSGTSLAQSYTDVQGEILKITKKRTGFVIDLAGDAVVEKGAKVKLEIDGKRRRGKVRKISKTGKSFIKLTKGLPKSVKKGDILPLSIEAVEGKEDLDSGRIRLAKGYRAKAYWDDVSYLATHRRSGLRADVEVGYLASQGARNTSGGDQGADIEYAVTDKTTGANGAFGWVGRGGFGGGLLFDYAATERVVSAEVDTAATNSTDDVKDTSERTVQDFTPYIAWLSRAKTGDLGFGAGLGFLMRSTTVDTKFEDYATADPEPAKATQSGVTLEFLAGGNTWATIVQINPGIKGTETQKGADDVERTSSEFGIHVETYGRKIKTRAGFVYLSDKGESDTFEQKDTGWRISTRLDWDMRKFHLVPFLDYTRVTRDVGGASGTATLTEIGTRVAWAGVYAPFVSLGAEISDEEQSGSGIADQETSVGGFKVAGGLSI